MVTFKVDHDNIQIDRLLKIKLNIGLRKIKELIKENKVVVNDKPCRKRTHILNKGDLVYILDYHEELDIEFDLNILEENKKIFGVYKPHNFHSVSGKSIYNIEHILTKKFNKKIYLLNRLDYLTSGIILFCFSKEVVNEYKIMQNRGLIEKRYLAIVHGLMSENIIIKNIIDDNKRKKVKVLEQYDEDKLRHTYIVPKMQFKNKKQTLVEAKILKGKRHQIRAHLSYIGHPIVGDSLYGYKEENNTRMFLHNYMVIFPDFVLKIDDRF